jgi:hypothetical protein
MMRRLAVLLPLVALLGLAACDDEPVEEAGDALQSTAEEAGDAVEEATD